MRHSGRIRVSREGRDTLWLLAVLSLSLLPHLGRLPLWCAIGAAGAILWRGVLAWRDAALPPRWVLLGSLAASVALTLWTFHSLFGREAGVTLVTLLAALKTLELRARRDAFVVTSLGFFLILTQFLYSQSLPIAALMLLVLLGLLTSLVLAQRPTGRPTIWSALKVASRSVVMGLPVMAALYLLFPRLGPLWSAPADAGARTGLSNRITLGHVADMALDDSVAMRVRFAGAAPAPRSLYFRGPVLDVFDGQSWQSQSAFSQAYAHRMQPMEQAALRPVGPALRYQVTLEPTRISAVPLLEGTFEASPSAPATEPQLRRQGLDWLATPPINARVQIDAQAWLQVAHGPVQPTAELGAYLQLPAGFNPRTLRWAMHLRGQPAMQQADPRALSQAVLQHIRTAGYRYTLAPDAPQPSPDRLPDVNLIDQFWLDGKQGFCEHFASAYVVVMRAMGIPARVITGYQGAELNPVDGYHVVRNSDAHAWAEFWQPGEGWVRVDPTAAVAPDRVERPRQAYGQRDKLPGPLSNIDSALWGKLRAYAEAGNHKWNVWVLQYSRNSQLELLKDWGFESPNWVDLLRLCGVILAASSLLGVAWLWWTRPKAGRNPWRAPLMRVHRALLHAGLPAPADSPAPASALQWAARVQSSRRDTPALTPVRQALLEALSQLDTMRYAPQHEAQHAARRSQALVAEIEQQAQRWRAGLRRDQAN